MAAAALDRRRAGWQLFLTSWPLVLAAMFMTAMFMAGIAGGVAAKVETAATAFALAQLDIEDEHGFAEYGAQVPATIAQHGGAVTLNAVAEAIEGAAAGWVIIILPDARAWLRSPEYTAIKGIRHRTAETRHLLVEGLPAD